MVEDFNPQVGELVEVFPHEGRFKGLFENTSIYAGADRVAFLLDLKRIKDGRVEKGIPTYLVDYPKEIRVRRALEKTLAESGSWPEDFQTGRFDLEFDEMYDGTPRMMVTFYLRSEAESSLETARARNNFYSMLQEKFQPVMDDEYPGRWLQFAAAKEERSALSAAS
jgi:hypothetical protein